MSRDVEIVNRAKSEEASDYAECWLFQKWSRVKEGKYSIVQP